MEEFSDAASLINSFASRGSITIGGHEYKLRNIVYATDGSSVLKTRFMLERTLGDGHAKLDIAISAVVYED